MASSGSGSGSAGDCWPEAVQAFTIPLPPLAPFRITGPKLCNGCFGGKEGNSTADGARLIGAAAGGEA